MARTSIFIAAPPETVFDALARPSSEVAAAGAGAPTEQTGSLPDPGEALVPGRAAGPGGVGTSFAVTEVARPTRLALEATGPGLRAAVDVEIRSRFGATLVVLTDRPVDGPAARVPEPLLDIALRARDRRLLERAKRLAESRLRRA
jgi:uncharacterized protein YndB with AHSA1/START domain